MPKKVVDKTTSNYTGGLSSGWQRALLGLRGLCPAVLGYMLVGLMKLTVGLIDVQYYGRDHVLECRRQGRPIIFAGWHGHNFITLCTYYVQYRKVFKGVIMVPESMKGRILNHFAKKLHLDVIKVKAGPSQWARATVSMIKLMRGGDCALLSPDGPDGPACKVKPGIALMGQQAKAVIIPASAAAKRAVRLRSRWDNHLIPLPFSRTVVYFGPPIDTFPADGPCPSIEELQQSIEAALIEGAQKAEELSQRSGLEGGVR